MNGTSKHLWCLMRMKAYLRFMLLSGVRAMDGVKSFNLLVELGDRYKEEYYNQETVF